MFLFLSLFSYIHSVYPSQSKKKNKQANKNYIREIRIAGFVKRVYSRRSKGMKKKKLKKYEEKKHAKEKFLVLSQLNHEKKIKLTIFSYNFLCLLISH